MLRLIRWGGFFLFVLIVVSSARTSLRAAEGDRVTGTMTVDKQTTPLKYVYARKEEDSFNKGKQEVIVLLSDQPIAAEDREDDFGVIKLARDGKVHAIALTINEEKQVTSGHLFHEKYGEYGANVSVSGMHEFEPVAFTADVVEGKAYVKSDQEFFNHHWQYEATFRVSLKLPPPTGTPLPAGGGDPGKAYMVYHKALMEGDIPTLKTIIPPENVKDLDGPDGKKTLELIKMMSATDIKILGGTIDGKSATLHVEGVNEGTKSTGTVKMALDGTQWRLVRESWK
ncbi:MAG: hypothetical protein PHX83_09290 [Acidobacteriia bacterium]|nr:hypothetical protein [Terriglobia bacterium]